MPSDDLPDSEDQQPTLEPSTLFVFWAEPEPPLDEEVRLGLQAAFPEIRWIEDLEATGGVIWGNAFRLPEHAAGHSQGGQGEQQGTTGHAAAMASVRQVVRLIVHRPHSLHAPSA